MLLLEALEMTRNEGNKVVYVRLFLLPSDHLEAGRGINLLRCLASVGKHQHVLGHPAGHGGGEEFVGGVEARKPMAGLDGFALRPDMRVTGIIAKLGRAKVETLGRLGFVGHAELHLTHRRNRFDEGDEQGAVGVLPSRDPGTRLDGLHLQIDRIEAQLLQRLEHGLESEGGDALHAAILEVRRYVEREMNDVHLAFRSIALDGVVYAGKIRRCVAALQAVTMLGSQGMRQKGKAEGQQGEAD